MRQKHLLASNLCWFWREYWRSIDYWLKDLPIAFKFFSQANIIPQAPPFTDVSTMFTNIGVSSCSIKRHQAAALRFEID